MKLYLAGPMRGIPYFNFPAFDKAAANLRARGYEVFSPAENDRVNYGAELAASNPTGNEARATATHGFNLRAALGTDLAYICAEADGIALLPGWRNSKGATAEHATAVALGLTVIFIDQNGREAL